MKLEAETLATELAGMEQECPNHCESGWVPPRDQHQPCPDCHGTGKVKVFDDSVRVPCYVIPELKKSKCIYIVACGGGWGGNEDDTTYCNQQAVFLIERYSGQGEGLRETVPFCKKHEFVARQGNNKIVAASGDSCPLCGGRGWTASGNFVTWCWALKPRASGVTQNLDTGSVYIKWRGDKPNWWFRFRRLLTLLAQKE